MLIKLNMMKNQVSFLIPADVKARVAGSMTQYLANIKTKRHTGQREGPRWKTLAFVYVVSLLVTVNIL